MKKSKLIVTPITMALTFIGLSLAHLSPLVSAVNVTTTTPEPVSAKALWQPGMSMIQEMREKCGAAGTAAGECFAAEMRRSGASEAAVAFTNLIGNTGYLRDFREAGRVDVAYVNYPFRANENQGCLLVNGEPAVIDVDDVSKLSSEELMKNKQYAALAAKHPNAALFPGDRSGTGYPQMESLDGGGQRFIVGYWLTDGCHACARLGSARVAFDFDNRGKLIGRKLIGVGPAK